MELSERKKKILASLIERYIMTGEPIGSKVLCEGLAVSSATVRNEMSELSDYGYLLQPHTSAGRIPSQKGFRYYIDHLMPMYDISDADRYLLHNSVDSFDGEVTDILSETAGLLSEITGCAVAVQTPYDINAYIRRVELVPIGAKSALIVVVMSTGIIKNKMCRCDAEIDISTAELFYNVANAHFIGRTSDELTVANIQTVVASLGDRALFMTPLLVALKELAVDASERNVIIEGQSKLFAFKELESDVYDIFEGFRDTSYLSGILSDCKDDTSIIIGRESRNRAFENLSIVNCKYKVDGRNVGSIAVIGPLRMDYSRIISNLKNISETVGNVLSELTEE